MKALSTSGGTYRIPLRFYVPWVWHVLVFFAAALLLISRRPDVLSNAQFWAEDGTVWYYGAYTFGPLKALLIPHTGYYQTLPRLVAAFSLWFPISWAPLIFNLVALGIQILPVLVLLSSRYAHIISLPHARLLLAFAYLAMPNGEVHANLTNAQWHLALTTAVIVLAEPSAAWGWRCFDLGTIALTGVSGPFSLILAPIVLLRAYVQRNRWLLYLGLVLSVGALVQLTAYSQQTHVPRLDGQVPLGASPTLFFRIVGGQVFAQAVVGYSGFSWLSSQAVWLGQLPLFVCVVGLGALIYALWRGPLELRLFTLFAAWIMFGALVTPVASLTTPQWEILALPGSGLRYWRIPVLAFILVLGYLAYKAPIRVCRWTTVGLLLAAAAGNLYDWRYAPWTDLHWPDHAQAFTAAKAGTTVHIPIQPEGWTMALVKH